jgi:hypothetical protein
MFSRKVVSLFLALMLLSLPLAHAYAAGGTVTGIVTDPKGSVIVGAAITLIDPLSNQTFTAITDKNGRYKIEGLPAGTYVISVSATGFGEVRRENVKIEEDKTAAVDVKLEISVIEEAVNVSAGGMKANTDPTYMQLRQKSGAETSFDSSASVSNLVLKRDAGTFILRSGEIYFVAPVEGRRTAAVFIGEGTFNLTPPIENEKRSLALFVDKPTLDEEFTQLVLHFTDQTFDEIKASPNATMHGSGAQAARARDIYRDNQILLRSELRSNIEQRKLIDMYSTATRPGFFVAFIGGRRFNKLVYEVDPLGSSLVSPEQVSLFSYGTTDGGIWAGFYMADAYRTGNTNSSQYKRLSDISHHEIDLTIRGTKITVSDTVTFSATTQGTRVLPFDLSPSLRVSRVQDEEGRDLSFIQEKKTEDAQFAVIWPQALSVGQPHKVVIQYAGEGAVKDYGGGNFALVERSNWYPSIGGTQFGDRAIFDVTVRYPKGNMFVGVGALVGEETQEGDLKVAKWSSGTTELTVAGFNYGKFKKKMVEDKESGYGVEFYANTQLAPELKDREARIRMAEAATGQSIETLSEGEVQSSGAASTTSGADAALADTQNAMRIYNEYFGKLPYSRIAMTQQPFGFFGQSWPTLVYMPYTAFLNPTERVKLFGSQGGTNTFWEYVGPHEVAHQWWGHIIGWSSYRDQWMSEGFAELSASLYVQKVYGVNKFIDFWEAQRKEIVQATPATKGRKPYTIGPVTQGYRLSSAKTGGAYQMVYPKGAYILHMLRMLMWDTRSKGDPEVRFKAMMHDFVKSHYNKDVSTEDFKRIVDKHTTREANLDENGRMDWFFNQWVYGTEVPAYKFDYQINSSGGKTLLSGHITQSGVSDNFRMLVPVWVSYDGKGWTRLGSATIVGNSSVDLNNIPLTKEPKKVAICALNDVLATSIENTKR